MSDEDAQRKLLDAARQGLSPSKDAKDRVRTYVLSLGAPGHNAREHPNEESSAELGGLLQKPAGDITPPRSAGRLALLAGLGVGGLLGFGTGHYTASVSSTDDTLADVRTVSVPTQAFTAIAASDPSVRAPDEPTIAMQTASPPTGANAEKSKWIREVVDAGRRKTNQPSTPSSIEDEVLWVQRIRKALARREPALALGLLRELDAKVPVGRLAEERAAGYAIARCMLQPSDGRTELASFVSRYPSSVHLSRLTATCNASPSSLKTINEKP